MVEGDAPGSKSSVLTSELTEVSVSFATLLTFVFASSIKKFDAFYPAEESHQKYLIKNPDGYSCHFVRKLSF